MRNTFIPTLGLVVLLSCARSAAAEAGPEYIDQRDSEANQYRDLCFGESDSLLCLTDKGFNCIPKDMDGKDAWYCSLELNQGKFEAIVFYGASEMKDRLRWRSED